LKKIVRIRIQRGEESSKKRIFNEVFFVSLAEFLEWKWNRDGNLGHIFLSSE
jgi:hypothetical protein